MANWLERARIRRGLFFSSGFLEVALIFSAICMKLLTTSDAQAGFLSIDCGSVGNYTDSLHLDWVTDNGTYIMAGNSFSQSFLNSSLLNSTGDDVQALRSFRYFPERRNKYCYELPTSPDVSYLIRARFYMNKYELAKRQPFQFITFINSTEWFTITSSNDSQYDVYHQFVSQPDLFVTQEAIFYSPNNVTYFCLQPVVGVPFISSLELRQLNATMYSYSNSQQQYLSLLFRYNTGSNSTIPEVVRYPEDKFDRIWQPLDEALSDAPPYSFVASPTPPDPLPRADVNYVPPKVMQTALCNPEYGQELAIAINLYPNGPHVYLTSMEYAFAVVYVEDLKDLPPYSMNITLFADYLVATFGIVSNALNVSNQASMLAMPHATLSSQHISLSMTPDPNSLATLNAVEVYGQFDFNLSTTYDGDAEVIRVLKRSFSLTDWQGDPCTPVPHDWLSCSSILIDACDGFGGCGRQGFLAGTYFVSTLNLSYLSPSGWSFITSFPDLKLHFLTEMTITHSGLDTGAFEFIMNNLLDFAPVITMMDFSYNAIENIRPQILGDGLWELSFLNLSHNSLVGELNVLENAPLLGSLYVLDLSYNALSFVSTTWVNATSNLTLLDLSHNKLQGEISSLDHLVQINSGSLQELNISDNNLHGTFSSSLYFTGLPNLKIAICDRNTISGTLNLSTWQNELQRVVFQNLTKTNVTSRLFTFVDNNISDIFPSASVLESTIMTILLENPSFGVLLGGNPYCKGAKSFIQRYLCRSTIHDDIPKMDKKNKDIMIVGICAGIFMFLVCCATLVSMWKLWRQVYALREIQQALAHQKVKPPFFEYEELKLATKDFHKDNELGRGGFGVVYKGVLEDQSMLAVKKLFNCKNLSVLNDFLNEVVLITGIKHRNLVQLKGCCIRDKQRMLVYDYVEKGNLGQALWGNKIFGSLNWEQRFKICVGVARGLSYLHEELQPSIIHRDIKPENILLDEKFQPKIADFGLARNFSNESSQALYTQIAGTLGYFSPEYATVGQLSEKADVYSYGIVILEVVSGRKCIDSSLELDKKFLKDWVHKMHKEGLLLNILDPELKDKFVMAEVIRAINIALLCVQYDPERRPSMSQVVMLLMGNMDLKVYTEESQSNHSLEEDFLVVLDHTIQHPTFHSSFQSGTEEDSTYSSLLDLDSQSSRNLGAQPRSRSIVEMSGVFGH